MTMLSARRAASMMRLGGVADLDPYGDGRPVVPDCLGDEPLEVAALLGDEVAGAAMPNGTSAGRM